MRRGLLVILALLCAAARTAPSAPNGPSNEERKHWMDFHVLLDDCDQVVRAEVVRLRDVKREQNESTVRLIELRVDEVVWGKVGTRTLTVLDDQLGYYLHMHGDPQVGEHSYWFVERWPNPWSEDGVTRTNMEAVSGPNNVQVTAAHGLGRLLIEGDAENATVCLPESLFRLPESLPIAGRHETTDPERSWLRVCRDDFDRSLRAALSEIVPSIHAETRSNGPMTPYVTITPDGHLRAASYSWEGEKQMDLGVAGLKKILDLAEQRCFFDFPVNLGHSLGPDSCVGHLRIRTERGSRKIRIWGPEDPEHDTGTERAALTSALTIWNAIPIAKKWKLDGH